MTSPMKFFLVVCIALGVLFLFGLPAYSIIKFIQIQKAEEARTGVIPPAADEPGGGSGGAQGVCRPTGCSGQVCADEDVVTTCEYKAEFACYKNSKCERQTNGQCGWTETPELASCLEKARAGTTGGEVGVQMYY